MVARSVTDELVQRLAEQTTLLVRTEAERDELRARNADLLRVIAGHCMEVRNCLTNVFAYGELLQKSPPQEGDPSIHLDEMLLNVRRVREFVASLLTETRRHLLSERSDPELIPSSAEETIVEPIMILPTGDHRSVPS